LARAAHARAVAGHAAPGLLGRAALGAGRGPRLTRGGGLPGVKHCLVFAQRGCLTLVGVGKLATTGAREWGDW
jgi:hypothetical protein